MWLMSIDGQEDQLIHDFDVNFKLLSVGICNI